MARRDFDDFVTNVGTRLGNRSDISSDLCAWFLNDARDRCCAEYEHPQLEKAANETLTTGTDTFSAISNTTDLWWPVMVRDSTNGPILEPGDKQLVEGIATKPSGKPSQYYWWSGLFYFDKKPTTNTTIRIYYIKQLSYWATGEVSGLDRMFDVLIEILATAIGFDFLRDYPAAQASEAMAARYADKMGLPVRKARLDDWQSRIRVRTK